MIGVRVRVSGVEVSRGKVSRGTNGVGVASRVGRRVGVVTEAQLFADGMPARRSGRRGPQCGRRKWWAKQMEVRIAQIVERPASRYHHRVGVAEAQHAGAVLEGVGQHVDPEHEVFGSHPVHHRRGV